MVIIQNLDLEKINQTKGLEWSIKKEQQLENKVTSSLADQTCLFINFTTFLLKECYEVGLTNKSTKTLAEKFGCNRETVKRFLRKLDELGFILRCKMMSAYTKKNSSNLVVINWQAFDYHPPREYSIQVLKTLKHVNLVNPADRFAINALLVTHNQRRKEINNKVKSMTRKRVDSEKRKPKVSAGSNVYKNKKIKIDDQQSTAFAAGYLSNLVDNLSMSFLSNIDEYGFNRVRYQSDHLNRNMMHKAFCRELWQLHRNHGTDALINGCFYALSNISLFPKVSTAKRLAANFGLILRMQKQGIKLIAENTYPCRLERYEQCFEG